MDKEFKEDIKALVFSLYDPNSPTESKMEELLHKTVEYKNLSEIQVLVLLKRIAALSNIYSVIYILAERRGLVMAEVGTYLSEQLLEQTNNFIKESSK